MKEVKDQLDHIGRELLLEMKLWLLLIIQDQSFLNLLSYYSKLVVGISQITILLKILSGVSKKDAHLLHPNAQMSVLKKDAVEPKNYYALSIIME